MRILQSISLLLVLVLGACGESAATSTPVPDKATQQIIPTQESRP